MEEPSILSRVVTFLKQLLDGTLGTNLLGRVLHDIRSNNSLQLNIQIVTGGHHVIVVDSLDKGLDAAALRNALSAHGLGDLEWVTLDTSDNGVGIRAGRGTFIVVLDNDGLFTGILALEDQDDL